MTLQYWMRHPTLGTWVDITDRCRTFRLDVKQNAEEMSVAISRLIIDDPAGDLEVRPWRAFYILETEAEDPDQTVIYVGHSQPTIQIKRGPYRTGAGREWHVDLSDVNNMPERRLLFGTDVDRPAETDNARIAWVSTTDEGEVIGDTRYVTSSDTWAMDANDYLGQATTAVYRDCMEQSGKNAFVTHFGDVGSYPFGDYSLFYERPEAAVYSSLHRLTNDLASASSNTFWVHNEPVEFTIDGSRMGNKVYMPYGDSYVTATRDPGTLLPYRDLAFPALNVSTKAKAQARANRMVEDARTPEHRATLQFITPRSKVNAIREGMRVQVKMTHWIEPYDTEWTWMRVLSRQVTDISEEDDQTYLQTIEVSRSEPGPPAPPTYAVLYQSKGGNGDITRFGSTGDNPAAGWIYAPKGDLIEYVQNLSAPNPGWTYEGFEIQGTGTVDVRLFLTTAGVLDGNRDIVYSILLNGSVVASETNSLSLPPGQSLVYMADEQEVIIEGLAVEPGDIIGCSVSCEPVAMPFFGSPAGTGQSGESLSITDGTLS